MRKRMNINKIMKRKAAWLLIFLVAALFPAQIFAQSSQTIAIYGGTVLTMAGKTLNDGIVIVKDETIYAVGCNIRIPDNALKIDASGKYVLPGFIECNTSIGISGDNYSQDNNETSSVSTPAARAVDALYPFSSAIPFMRENGITALHTLPGNENVIGGQGAVIKTTGKTRSEMTMLEPSGLKISLGESPKRAGYPKTRMGIAWEVRKQFIEAKEYMEKPRDEYFVRDFGKEALAAVLRKEMPVYCEAYRADDILTALRIQDEFKFNMVLLYATEAYKVIDELKDRNVPVVYAPIRSLWYRIEREYQKEITAKILADAGVVMAIQSGEANPYGEAFLPLYAAFAIRGGLSEDDALKAVTINAAKILNVDDRIGSIEEGKDADIIVMNGHPLETRSQVELTLINGAIVYQRGKK